MTNSLTALEFAPGALKTGIPFSVIFSTGILLVPAPARPIHFTVSGISISCILYERSKMASGCVISDEISYFSRDKRFKPVIEILFKV